MTKIYIFHRAEGFYPLELPDNDAQIIDHVLCNPGTIKVEDFNGKIILQAEPQHSERG